MNNFSIEQNKIIQEISGYAIEFPLDYLRDENLAEVDKTSIKSVGLRGGRISKFQMNSR